jgi:4'-phosphopantetheinyl transferase
MVYVFDNIEAFSSRDLDAAYKVVSQQRRNYALKYHSEESRKLSIIAYLLLKLGLNKEYGITENVEFDFTDNGQPFLRDYPNIRFSLSHCKKGVACAISDEAIGVDIERINRENDALIRYTCNDEEVNAILASPNSATAFISLWTRKESYLKLKGTGIAGGLKDSLIKAAEEGVNFLTRIEEEKGYILSICSNHIPELIYCPELQL